MVPLRLARVFQSVLLITVLFSAPPIGAEAGAASVVLAEVVTDPQQDWDGSGSVTSSDEYVVLRNSGGTTVDLTGWRLVMEDSTPEEAWLSESLAPGESRLLVNPPGILNNDVALRLFDAAGAVVHEVVLDGVGHPDGDATGIGDEAVHLTGPWAGTKGPATAGKGLPRFWPEAVWPAATGLSPRPFEAVWLPAAPADLQLRIHVAPGGAAPTQLRVGDATAPLVQQDDGIWGAGPFTAAAPSAHLALLADDLQVASWPNGTLLAFPVDPQPPRLDGGPVAVVNATRHLQWIAPFTDDHSGLLDTALLQERDGVREALPDCATPADGAATCPLASNVTRIIATATDHAGQENEATLEVVEDLTPPVMPSSFLFEEEVPPRFGWPRLNESLSALAVELADDVGGTWNRTLVPVAPDARSFTDHGWVPGAPRAYRLVATDRGGNANQTPWVALPPEAVPVQVVPDGLEAALDRLLDNGTATVTLTFDRPVDPPPRLVLETTMPAPFRTAAEGTTAPDLRSASYVMRPGGDMPATGHGTWRLAGGAGADGAPVDPLHRSAHWDQAPPRIDVVGWQQGWVGGARHVVVVSAHDLGDPIPLLQVDVSERVVVRQDGPVAELALSGEGEHSFLVAARDAAGNGVTERFTLRLDATPPVLRLATAPPRWTPTAPLVVQVDDPASGVAPETLVVAVRTAQETIVPQAVWNGSRVALHTNGSVEGPFEITIQIQDGAGNEAAGLLGERIAAEPLRMTVTVNGTRDKTDGNTTDDAASTGSGSHFAPTSGEPVRSWSDHTGIPPLDGEASDGGDGDEGGSTSQILAAFVGAGLLGLGTVIHRRRRGRPPAEATDAQGKEGEKAPPPGP